MLIAMELRLKARPVRMQSPYVFHCTKPPSLAAVTTATTVITLTPHSYYTELFIRFASRNSTMKVPLIAPILQMGKPTFRAVKSLT